MLVATRSILYKFAATFRDHGQQHANHGPMRGECNARNHGFPEAVATVPINQFAGCEGRILIESGSFFARVPQNCDAYVLKHIIHNWSDDDCRKILTLVREQLPAHGRVLICEMVIQNDPGPTPAKMLDIEMLVMTVGGKERSPEEFRDLLSSAGLRLGCIITTPNPLCVIEAFAN
jgi:hypothetical protein